MAEKLNPVAFMHKFMKLLSQDYQEQQNKLDLTLQAMTTGIEGKSVLHNANELKNAIKADISSILQNGTAKDFLKQKCNIDLDNEDTGSLLGFDCSGRDILNDADVVKEEGEIKNHPSSAVINGCTLTFTNYSDAKRKFVMNGLYTWWIPLAFDKIKEGYGLEYTEDSFVRQMPISLYDKPSQNGLIEGAYVSTTYLIETGVATKQTLNINMNDAAYGTIIIGDKSGATEVKNFGSLDRTLLHELTHALMGANIQWFSALPSWFVEGGTAVLLEGADDTRQAHILNAVSNTAIIDNGFSNSPTNTNEYSVGFLAMRYLLANYADRQQKIIFESNPLEPFEIMWQKNAHGIKSEFCISRDGDLNKIMNEFSDFVQRNDYNEVQPWDLVRDNNMGKTFRIPMKDYTETEEDVVADFSNIGSLYQIGDEVGLSFYGCYNCSVPTISVSDVTYESNLLLKWNPNNSQFPLQDVTSRYNNAKGIIVGGMWYPFDSILLEFFGCSLDVIPNSLYSDIYNILDFNLQYDEDVIEEYGIIYDDIPPKAHLFLAVVDILYPNIDTSLDDISFRRSFCQVTEDMKNTADFLENLGATIIDARPNILDELESLIKTNDRFSSMSDMSLAESYVFAESSDFAYRDYWHECKKNVVGHSKVVKYVQSPDTWLPALNFDFRDCAILTNSIFFTTNQMKKETAVSLGYIEEDDSRVNENGYIPKMDLYTFPRSTWYSQHYNDKKYDYGVAMDENCIFLDCLNCAQFTGDETSVNILDGAINPYNHTRVNNGLKSAIESKGLLFENYSKRCTDIEESISSIIEMYNNNTDLKNIVLALHSEGYNIYRPIFGYHFTKDMFERLKNTVNSRGGKLYLFMLPTIGSGWLSNYNQKQNPFNEIIDWDSLYKQALNPLSYFPDRLDKEYIGEVTGRVVYNDTMSEEFFNWFKTQLGDISILGYDLSKILQNNPDSYFDSFVTSTADFDSFGHFYITNDYPIYLPRYSETFWKSLNYGMKVTSHFVVTESENKKFPCFYLSTGVFKPKDWINEGLKYPEHVIKGENQNDEYIPFNIHVLYDKNMRFDLQGQGTAKRTTGAEGNAYILDGVEGNPDTGYYPVESDAIPGIGCPMIVCSQENKITYPYIECYFTKTNYSGTVTLIFYSADNEAQNPVFQSVAFGLGKSEESSYKYPLYTAGGSCGLYPYGYTFTWTDTGRPPTTHTLYIGGQKINFDMSKGESLSSLLYPCGIEKSNISNVRIMQPDGRWVSAKNFMQTQESMNGTCGSMLTKSDIESSTIPMIYPTISDIDNVDRFTFTQPVMVIRKRVDEEDESGFTLAFDGVKAKADRLRAIFTAKDGHEYLSVPNGWYSRTFGIPYTTGAAESGENILDVIARLNKNMPKQNYVLTIDLG